VARPNRSGVDWSDPDAVAAYKRANERHHEYNREYKKRTYKPVPQPHARAYATRDRAPVLPEVFATLFWSRVACGEAGDCWPWTGATWPRGYGKVQRDCVQLYVHRVAWELTYGEIPPDARLKRTCAEMLCCNPAHYEMRSAHEHEA